MDYKSKTVKFFRFFWMQINIKATIIHTSLKNNEQQKVHQTVTWLLNHVKTHIFFFSSCDFYFFCMLVARK